MTDIRIVGNEDGTCCLHAEGTSKFITVKADSIQLAISFAEYNAGVLIQDAFPYLNAEEREFILTGMTPEEQERFYGDALMGSDDYEPEVEDDDPQERGLDLSKIAKENEL